MKWLPMMLAVALSVGCGSDDSMKKAPDTDTNVGSVDGGSSDTPDASTECLEISPEELAFQTTGPGASNRLAVEVTNCGGDTVEVVSLSLLSSAPFSLLDPVDSATLAPGEVLGLVVVFAPAEEGIFIESLVIETERDRYSVSLTGEAEDLSDPCPLAEGRFLDPDSRDPLPSSELSLGTRFILDGSPSSYSESEIGFYEWTVTYPDGNVQTRSNVEETVFPDQSGTYVFELEVTSVDGVRSCEAWSETVEIGRPSGDIFIELTWKTPEDPDPLDDIGSDVDLHFLKITPDSLWFNEPWDVYFRNPNSTGDPIWGAESPRLVSFDDTNGGGPESISMPAGDNCEWYAIGVHYYRELFGQVYYDLRVWSGGVLEFEVINRPLQGGQFDDIARIHWPSATFIEVGNTLEPAPANEPPAPVQAIADSGLCVD